MIDNYKRDAPSRAPNDHAHITQLFTRRSGKVTMNNSKIKNNDKKVKNIWSTK